MGLSFEFQEQMRAVEESIERERGATPETDGAAYEDPTPGFAVVSYDFARNLERERDEVKAYAEKCRQGCIELSHAISKIDYICGEPNEMEVSDYCVHQDEEAVVERVRQLRRERDDLLVWKSEQMKVEASWDAQAVGELLGLQPGSKIRPQIQPAIEAMRGAIKEAHAALSELVSLGSLELPQRRDAALLAGRATLAKLQPFPQTMSNSPINDGGPAFPMPAHHDSQEGRHRPFYEGMSLRDWFAGQANETDIEAHEGGEVHPRTGRTINKRTREQAKYAYADAMIAARNQQPEKP